MEQAAMAGAPGCPRHALRNHRNRVISTDMRQHGGEDHALGVITRHMGWPATGRGRENSTALRVFKTRRRSSDACGM
jgi:hypothetical protein